MKKEMMAIFEKEKRINKVVINKKIFFRKVGCLNFLLVKTKNKVKGKNQPKSWDGKNCHILVKTQRRKKKLWQFLVSKDESSARLKNKKYPQVNVFLSVGQKPK
jgi:hypothetical protein